MLGWHHVVRADVVVDELPSWLDAPALGADMVSEVAVVGASVVQAGMGVVVRGAAAAGAAVVVEGGHGAKIIPSLSPFEKVI